jgi:hypothetical protein
VVSSSDARIRSSSSARLMTNFFSVAQPSSSETVAPTSSQSLSASLHHAHARAPQPGRDATSVVPSVHVGRYSASASSSSAVPAVQPPTVPPGDQVQFVSSASSNEGADTVRTTPGRDKRALSQHEEATGASSDLRAQFPGVSTATLGRLSTASRSMGIRSFYDFARRELGEQFAVVRQHIQATGINGPTILHTLFRESQ